MLTPSADTMPLGIVVERTPEGGIQGELFFGRTVSAAERASMAGTGQRFRGERLDARRHRLGSLSRRSAPSPSVLRSKA